MVSQVSGDRWVTYQGKMSAHASRGSVDRRSPRSRLCAVCVPSPCEANPHIYRVYRTAFYRPPRDRTGVFVDLAILRAYPEALRRARSGKRGASGRNRADSERCDDGESDEMKAQPPPAIS
jgi:hypothetical protein